MSRSPRSMPAESNGVASGFEQGLRCRNVGPQSSTKNSFNGSEDLTKRRQSGAVLICFEIVFAPSSLREIFNHLFRPIWVYDLYRNRVRVVNRQRMLRLRGQVTIQVESPRAIVTINCEGCLQQ